MNFRTTSSGENEDTGGIQDPLKRNRTLMIITVAGFLILIVLILIGMFFSGNSNQQGDGGLIGSMETRLRQMESRLRRIDDLEKRIALLDKQNTEFAISIMDRVDRLEASMSLRVAQIAKEQANVHKAAVRSQNMATGQNGGDTAAKGAAKTRHHRVSAGETLYRISLKYGLNVEDLLRLNNLAPGAVIFAGQDLVVGADVNK